MSKDEALANIPRTQEKEEEPGPYPPPMAAATTNAGSWVFFLLVRGREKTLP